MMCFSSFYHKIMFSAVKNAKAILISYFHSYVYIKHRFGMYFKSFKSNTYMYMLCFYYSGNTESFLIEKIYKGVFSVHF